MVEMWLRVTTEASERIKLKNLLEQDKTKGKVLLNHARVKPEMANAGYDSTLNTRKCCFKLPTSDRV